MIASAGNLPTREALGGRDPGQLVQIYVDMSEDESPLDGEVAWGLPVQEGVCEVVGLPFFTFETCKPGDLVRVSDSVDIEGERAYLFAELVEDGGHETFPVIFADGVSEGDVRLAASDLQGLGATIDIGFDRIIAVDMPPSLPEANKSQILQMVDQYDEHGFLEE